MNSPDERQKPECLSKCRKCPADSDGPQRVNLERPVSGAALVGFSAGLFLAPLFLAIAGAFVLPLIWSNSFSQIVGVAGGMSLGILGAVLVAAIFRRVGKRRS